MSEAVVNEVALASIQVLTGVQTDCSELSRTEEQHIALVSLTATLLLLSCLNTMSTNEELVCLVIDGLHEAAPGLAVALNAANTVSSISGGCLPPASKSCFFTERYSELRRFDFGNAGPALLTALQRLPELCPLKDQLMNLITGGVSPQELLLREFADRTMQFRTTYD